MHYVISEVFYKGATLQRNRKMTIRWSFSYNSFVKFHGKKIETTTQLLYPNLCYNKVCYKVTELYFKKT